MITFSLRSRLFENAEDTWCWALYIQQTTIFKNTPGILSFAYYIIWGNLWLTIEVGGLVASLICDVQYQRKHIKWHDFSSACFPVVWQLGRTTAHSTSPKCVIKWTKQESGLVTLRRHQTETFSALLAICAENSPATGEFPAQRPVTRSFDFFFHLRLNERLSKQSRCWWFKTPSRPLWRHSNEVNPCENPC